MSDYWKNLERDGGGRWIEDDVPNQKERPMATRKPSKSTEDETEQEKAVDQREVQPIDEHASSEPSDGGKSADGPGTGPEDGHADATDDPHASDSDLPPFTGIDGEAFPDRPEPILSDQTETVENTYGTEYEQPKFTALRSDTDVKVSPYNWVGPEALTVPLRDLDDFKAFVASL